MNGIIEGNKSGYLCNNEKSINFINCEIKSNEYFNRMYTEYYNFDIDNAGTYYFQNDPNNKNRVSFIEREKIIAFVGGNEIVVSDDFPSKPDLHNNKLVFVAPYDFETISDLHLFDIDKEQDVIILTSEEVANTMEITKTIKRAVWKSVEEILFIYGDANGTISQGGDVYNFNIITREYNKIYECKDLEEVSDIMFTEDKKDCILEIIKHDKDLNRFSKVLRILNF